MVWHNLCCWSKKQFTSVSWKYKSNKRSRNCNQSLGYTCFFFRCQLQRLITKPLKAPTPTKETNCKPAKNGVKWEKSEDINVSRLWLLTKDKQNFWCTATILVFGAKLPNIKHRESNRINNQIFQKGPRKTSTGITENYLLGANNEKKAKSFNSMVFWYSIQSGTLNWLKLYPHTFTITLSDWIICIYK